MFAIIICMTGNGKRAIIIGSGISGFSAGINLLLNGFDVSIYEKNPFYGGCCGVFEENEMIFDHCIHWMIGTLPNSKENKMWSKIHAFNNVDSIYNSPFLSSFVYEGQTLHIHKDYKKNIDEWVNVSIIDRKAIIKLNKQFKHAYNFFASRNIFKRLPFLFNIIKGLFLSRADIAKKFKHPGLKALISTCQNGECCWTFFLFEYGHFMNGNAGIPEGGSRKVINNIKTYYEKLGGKLFLNSPVSKINIENKIVKSIEVNGKKIAGDYFISACAPEHTLKNLLNSKYEHRGITKLRKRESKYKTPSFLQINFLCSGDTSSIPISCGFLLEKPLKVVSSEMNYVFIRTYNYDEKLYLKNNKIPLVVFVDQYKEDFKYFENLSHEKYEEEKRRISEMIMKEIETRYPHLKNKLSYISMITPLSFEETFNSPNGAYMGFPIPKGGMFKLLSPKIKGINNLYLASNWLITPGGTPFANISGIRASKQIIKKCK